MSTVVTSASQAGTTVEVRDSGAKGEKGTDGADAVGFQSVRKSVLDNPLCHLFAPNNAAVVSAPTNTDADITHTRASTATYVDRYGIVRTAAIDVLREEADGDLIEAESTNELLHSIDASNAAWFKAAGVSVIANDIPSCIDGESADRLTNTSGGISEHITQTYAYTDTSQDITTSFIIKAGTVTENTIRIIMAGGTVIDSTAIFDYATESFSFVAANATARLVKKLADGFYWLSITTTGNGTNNSVVSRLSSDDVGTWYFAGSQSEDGNKATSLIITTASAGTRDEDDVSINALNNIPEVTKSYSVSARIRNIGDFTGYTRRLVSFTAVTGIWALFASNTNNNILARVDDGVGVNQIVATPADINDFNVVVTFDDTTTTLSLYIDGEFGQSKVLVSQPTLSLSGIAAFFALQLLTSDNRASGNISDLRVWDKALNADEIKLLSGN